MSQRQDSLQLWSQKDLGSNSGLDASYPWELGKPFSSLSFCFLLCKMGINNSTCLPGPTRGLR